MGGYFNFKDVYMYIENISYYLEYNILTITGKGDITGLKNIDNQDLRKVVRILKRFPSTYVSYETRLDTDNNFWELSFQFVITISKDNLLILQTLIPDFYWDDLVIPLIMESSISQKNTNKDVLIECTGTMLHIISNFDKNI